jgi:hypothetical protein
VNVREYYLDRMQARGPFVVRKPVRVRAPQTEIALLSAIYTFLQDEGHTIDNPCHRPRTRRKDGLLAAYRPAHKPVIPTPEQRRAIFTANPLDEYERPLVSDAHRALFKLCYYTAARPESEPCRLRHGDVTLGDEKRWGSVTYCDTKTGDERRILLHPEVESDLRMIMLPVPMAERAREKWAKTPVFCKRGRTRKPWDSHSYRKAWSAIRCAVGKQSSEIADMWLRDFRPTAKTVMVDAGVPSETTKAILGHKGNVADGYYRLTDNAQQRALETLSLGDLQAAAGAAGQQGKRRSGRDTPGQ